MRSALSKMVEMKMESEEGKKASEIKIKKEGGKES
jgi:hypothetical protein